MTNEAKKIVDGLRCCNEIPHDCTKKGCYLASSGRICVMALRDDAADLIERLSEQLERTKRERDAAIHDVGIALHCIKCKYDGHQFKNVEPCNKCIHNWRGKESQWKWRGVCEENSGGDVE